MALDVALLTRLIETSPVDAWKTLVETVWTIMSPPVPPRQVASEIIRRDREVGRLDHFLSSCGWELWRDLGDEQASGIPRTAAHLVQWFHATQGGRAVLVLDGLSLRELPWILEGARERAYTIHQERVTAAEIPGDTTPFAQALGLSSRSQLQNNGGGASHALQPVRTESVDYPFHECQPLVDASPNHLFWHHWPDSKLHDAAGAGKGLDVLTRDVAEQLASPDFWSLVQRLATGRRLVITSDHGYAATGLFTDAPEDAASFLKDRFASGRRAPGAGDAGSFVPPVAMCVDGPRGPHVLALGRFKWRSQGGYPTLTHGGLSLLEMLCPFIELSL